MKDPVIKTDGSKPGNEINRQYAGTNQLNDKNYAQHPPDQRYGILNAEGVQGFLGQLHILQAGSPAGDGEKEGGQSDEA